MGFAIIGLGVLAGGPGGGGILGNGRELHWTGTWIYAGVTCLAASAIFAAVRFMTGSAKLRVKV
ncbi:hypothetical protein CLAFUW4_01846 [Fulvia fulva]|uniref:Uncharacterized protein n=1 Tax=Passalora fulva TaxID=5499 RepID=A0A9Q8P3K6_PASFU|nr:uncharacterized protein CLAFUR5_01841 [Fulvia fulva]KAK4634579.1 hypothetical protein CLAFUR4_01841 [Fulvia fulva]KAK4638045.1 hypothetical protein CLAFUR0_01843 [Fulvia fulva]UJO11894.1 hypothetical protein CLAFUR5_01841 [Fulvia fulva]WPV09890.1 hypothetical protein CLAFUW4_01846 [Fulvia fulva]WPV25280.1 hypothetical protein CLAFUW7_01845 [Fulvia fulva]